MSDGSRLASMMIKAGRTPQNDIPDIVFGEVKTIDPITVMVGDQEILSSFLIIGDLCKETHRKNVHFTIPQHKHTVLPITTTEYTHTHSVPTIGATSPDTHSHTVPQHDTELQEIVIEDLLLWRGLQVGDKVLMFKMARGQKFYIMQRVSGLDIEEVL